MANRKLILKILIESKELYVKRYYPFMCFCIRRSMIRYQDELPDEIRCNVNHCDISNFIPEFTAINLTGINACEEKIWWKCIDRESRLLAFDKLIAIYSDIKEISIFYKVINFFKKLYHDRI